MPDLKNLVEAKLGSGDGKDSLELWRVIWASYERGGPDAVENELQKRLKAVKSAALKEMRETKKIVPKKKSRRRRR